jgi:hypothetical protein
VDVSDYLSRDFQIDQVRGMQRLVGTEQAIGDPSGGRGVQQNIEEQCGPLLMEWTDRAPTLVTVLAIPEVEKVRERPSCARTA